MNIYLRLKKYSLCFNIYGHCYKASREHRTQYFTFCTYSKPLSSTTFHSTGGLKAFVFFLMLFTAQFLNLEAEIKIKAIFYSLYNDIFVCSKCSCHTLKYVFNGHIVNNLKSKLCMKIC